MQPSVRLKLLDDCVHCGFCLPACPTYRHTGLEAQSPRGRIHLMKLNAKSELRIDDAFRSAIDSCLGCMACMPACPSGVQYEPLLEQTRTEVEQRSVRTMSDALFRRAALALFPRRPLLRLTAAFGWLFRRSGLERAVRHDALWSRLPERLRALVELLPPQLNLRDALAPLPAFTAAKGARRARVGVLAGCVQSVFFRDVHEATVRVLAAEGCDVVVPRSAGCCGALAAHSGHGEQARKHAKALIGAFEDAQVDRIVVDAAGCGSSLRHYGRLLEAEPWWQERAEEFARRTVDVVELLDALPPRAPRHPLPARVAYHDACHHCHAQGIIDAPRRVLRTIPELELLEVPDERTCCGSAGIYNLLEPAMAGILGQQKAKTIAALEPDYVAAANPGCMLQIGRYLENGAQVIHPIQLLDRSIHNPGSSGG